MIASTQASAAAAAAAATSSTASSAAATTSSGTSGANSDLSGQGAFLTLLVAQMNNQDPLNPMDSSQITSQLAQINTVEGIQQLSTQLTQLLSSVGAGQSVQDASLIGQQVAVPGNDLNYQGSAVAGAVSLPSAASQVTITINDPNGNPVRTLSLGAQAAGLDTFTWDGTSNSGAAVAPGAYTYSVSAVAGSQSLAATSYNFGKVSAITPATASSDAMVTVQGLGVFDVNQVQQIQ